MFQQRTGLLAGILIVASVAFFTIGCGSRASSAQKLFDKGEYQKVVDKYPDLEIARRARAKLAEDLLAQKQYEAVLKDYPDTPAAYKAKMEKAQILFDKGQYQAVIDSFPGSPLVATAKQRLADSLFASGQIDVLLARYPDAPQAKQIKEERGAAALAQANRLRGQAKTDALQKIAQEYAGTEAAKSANDQLFKIRSAETQKR